MILLCLVGWFNVPVLPAPAPSSCKILRDAFVPKPAGWPCKGVTDYDDFLTRRAVKALLEVRGCVRVWVCVCGCGGCCLRLGLELGMQGVPEGVCVLYSGLFAVGCAYGLSGGACALVC